MTLLLEASYQYIYREDGPTVDSVSLLLNLLMYTNDRTLDQYYRNN
jgi:hypothetical protein